MIRLLSSLLCVVSTTALAALPLTDTLKSLQSCYYDAEIRTEVVYCLEEEVRHSEQRLQAVLDRAANYYQALDAEQDQPRLYPALLTAQESFSTFREHQCQLQLEVAFPGSGASDIYRACVIAHNEWRAQELEYLLSE